MLFHQTPGPGSYKIIAVTVTRVQSPCYSMGSRVFPPEAWKATPGPAAYNAEKGRVQLFCCCDQKI